MTNLRTKDERPRGYVDPEGTTKTPFRAYLEREARDLEIPRPPRVKKIQQTEKIPPPPAGYERPTTWKRVAESPEGTVLLATHEGWESIAHDLAIERIEVKYASGEKKMETRVSGPVGRIYWRGNVLEAVPLASLRVPGAGEREKRHG